MADLISMLAGASGVGAEEADPNFNQTVLLLHGDGTNGAQNNTFLDGSTNNFTITRNGNTTQGTFSPFSVGAGEWSNYFDGNGDFLSVGSASDWTTFHNGSDWTAEFWVYHQSTSTQVICGTTGATAQTGFYIAINEVANQVGVVFFRGVPGSSAAFSSNAALTINAWNHVAITFQNSGKTCTFYINGVQEGSSSNTGFSYSASAPTNTLTVGQVSSTSYLNGYLSNFRLSTNIRTGLTSVPTAPYTSDANTKLLTCQSNRFVDNSTNAFAITRNGDVRVTPFSPFAPSAAYSASTNGGSGYFDGTGDYLSIADAAGLRFGTGNFTIQAWIYRNAAGAVHSIAAKGGASTGWVFQVHSDNKLRFTQTTTNIDSTGTIPAGAWTHVAVVREGTGTNQTKLYINGVNDGQATVTTDFNQTEQLNIGADRGNANPMNGYIAGFKYVVGTAETITVPTAPPTGGTALLNFTNAGIFDNTGKNNLETVGNAQIDTTTKKFGTGSMEFDGTGDYLAAPFNDFFVIGSGNYTIEFWIYLNDSTNRAVMACATSGTKNGWSLQTVSSKVYFLVGDGSTISTGAQSPTVSLSTWTHIACVKNGSSINVYANGVAGSSATVSNVTAGTSSLLIGDGFGLESSNFVNTTDFNGLIDDLRITKGVARYTAAFTPPTAAFPNE